MTKCCSHCQDYRYCDENLGSCCKYCYYHHKGECTYKKTRGADQKNTS